MKTTKKLFLLGLFGTICMGASAYDFSAWYGGNKIYYNITSSTDLTCSVTYETDSYKSYIGNINIPSTVIYNGKTYSVTTIGYNAFHGCSGLTSVTIPNSVTSIGGGAFSGCSGLGSVSIPKNITSIGENAFLDCSSLTSVIIPDGVKQISWSSFANCRGLISVIIPNSVTSIGENAFWGCTGLTSITIPNSVTTIRALAFVGCTNLTSVIISDLATWCSIKFEYGANPLIYAHSLFMNGVQIKDLIIPNSVTSIGSGAFDGCCSLNSVIIPNSVTSIGDGAFHGCTGLTYITIPNSVTSISYSAFLGCCNLTSIAVAPENTVYDSRENCNAIIKKQNNELVLGCKGTIIPSSVTSIGCDAFDCCTLTSITIPNNVTTIGDGAFIRCTDLTSVTIPNSVTNIGNGAFYGCNDLALIISKIKKPFAFGSHAFDGISSSCKLIVPYGTRDPYITTGWTENVFQGGIVEMNPEITLVDGTLFTNEAETFYDEINYTRSFNNTKWQSLYVPFEIPVTAELLEEFEFAYINAARQYDYDDDGTVDDMTIEIFKIKKGTLRANHPYLIRAKETGSKTITVSEATLYATQEISVDCSTTDLLFTFKGGYSKLGYDDIGGCYVLGGGTWNPVKEGGSMKPMRFYLKIESRGDGQVIPASASANPIRMTVAGEDGDATEIEASPLSSPEGKELIFDPQGRRVEHPERGIYIINGKKVLVQ